MKNLRNKLMYIMLATFILLNVGVAYAWINGVGSPSIDPYNPIIGTHDRMLNIAINMLPADLRDKIDIEAADYGTEMPDYNNTMCNCTYGIRDQRYHQVYYHRDGSLQDNSSARRAQEEYNLAMAYLNVGDNYNFSLHVGMMSHYIADVSNFAHTMGNGSDWGGEGLTVHGDYENFVANTSSKFFSSTSIKFDGVYNNITAYDATLDSANDTTFDNKFGDGTYNNTWMYIMVNNSPNLTYSTADPEVIARTRQSLNYSVNLIADVIYTMVSQNITITPNATATLTATPTVVPTYTGGSGSNGGNSGSSGGSSGGTSGGGGLGTAEPYQNVYKYEVQEHSVFVTPVSFKYTTPELGVYEALITSNQSNVASLRIEVLKNTSKLAGSPAPGIVYKNINAWIDYKRIKSATLRFKVENSWMNVNGISADDLKIFKWDNGSNEWIELLTDVLSKDDKYTYVESETDIVSGSYAISSIKEENVPVEGSTINLKVEQEVVQTEKESVSTEGKVQSPGFELLPMISILLIIYIREKKKMR